MTNPVLRTIRPEDSLHVANIIRTVMPEFGASGAGFAIHDKEVDDMFVAYNRPGCRYYVCVVNDKIVGGGGVAPLEGGDPDICELKKMYFLPEGRGKGWGEMILRKCIEAAAGLGYKTIYLETFNTMKGAMKVYEKNGFRKISGPQGNTGHFACDTFYMLSL